MSSCLSDIVVRDVGEVDDVGELTRFAKQRKISGKDKAQRKATKLNQKEAVKEAEEGLWRKTLAINFVQRYLVVDEARSAVVLEGCKKVKRKRERK